MIRYLCVAGKGKELSTFSNPKFPTNVAKFLRENGSDLIGKTNSDRNLRTNEVINVDGIDYMHVGSRKYYRTKKTKSWIPILCELSFIQPMLYKEKTNENAK